MTFDKNISKYWEIPGLNQINLEDSYVNDIVCSLIKVKFEIELVLCEEHPKYETPKPNEKYCYKTGYIFFLNVFSMKFHANSFMKTIDTDGSVDYGNIDVFDVLGDDNYHLEGSWGELFIKSDAPQISLKTSFSK